jgi:hypothetical protein
MRRTAPLLFILVVLLALIAGCASTTSAEKHPAARTVARLLELRRDDVRDPKRYAPFFMESELATALAEGSAEPTGTPRVPLWETPYVSEETSRQASVVVVWKADAAFEDWPAVNIFLLERFEDRWVVTDAIEATSAPAPLGQKDAELP